MSASDSASAVMEEPLSREALVAEHSVLEAKLAQLMASSLLAREKAPALVSLSPSAGPSSRTGEAVCSGTGNSLTCGSRDNNEKAELTSELIQRKIQNVNEEIDLVTAAIRTISRRVAPSITFDRKNDDDGFAKLKPPSRCVTTETVRAVKSQAVICNIKQQLLSLLSETRRRMLEESRSHELDCSLLRRRIECARTTRNATAAMCCELQSQLHAIEERNMLNRVARHGAR